jgi:hypothetical protein
MDRKAKGDAKLAGLTLKQQEQVDRWLFEENAAYRTVVERCQKELGVTLTISSVGRHYRREFRLRTMNRYARRADEKKELHRIMDQNEHPARNYRMILGLAENMAMEEALKPPEQQDFRKVGFLLRTIIAARAEATGALRAQMALEKLEFDAATECLIHKNELDRISEDESLNEADQIRAVREELFGPDLPE